MGGKMLVNIPKETKHVELVSYSGQYPNLCSGVLVLRIDGLAYAFGHKTENYDFKTGEI